MIRKRRAGLRSRSTPAMAAISINCLAVLLKELGWSHTRLIAELRRQAAVSGIALPKTESLIPIIGRWVNNH